ncbi:MAG: hypothetical protein WBZ15_09610 [Mycobacterium sp.]|uniref:hypothetical protein n=1 Tax=Mycobacterium sp. TaxID=1785 RepID=UPI003C65F6D6
MTKRTNDFQKLIRMLTQLLGDNAVVEESKMLADLVSGDPREVDIYAEGTFAGHTVNIGIECRDHKRRQGVGWVEQMHSKHERLPTNLLILVSPRGFTAPAITKASSYGIKTIALTQAGSDLATEVLASLGVTAWDITDARLSVSANIPTEWLERDAHAVAQDDGQILFYSSGGSQLVTSETFNTAAMGQHLAAHPELVVGEGETEFDVETTPINEPAFKGERLHAYWTAGGEPPVLVPVAMAVVQGTVKVLTQAVTVSPTGDIVYDRK